jgi:hypothetical protein
MEPKGTGRVKPLRELLRIHLLRLSEKWYEQHSERGFGRRREAKMGRKAPLRCSVRLHRGLLRPFSDSLSTSLGE